MSHPSQRGPAPRVGFCAGVVGAMLALTSCTTAPEVGPAPTSSVTTPETPTPSEVLQPPVTPAPTSDPADPGAISTAPRVATSDVSTRLVSVTATTQDDTDAVTFVFDGDALPAYDIRYVDRLLLGDEPIEIAGTGVLSVTFTDVTPDEDGVMSEAVPTNEGLDLPVVRQLLLVTNLGGTVQMGIGASAQVPFSLRLDGGTLTVLFQHE